jgi:hypothetical protein
MLIPEEVVVTKKDYELVADAIAFFGDKPMTHREKVLLCKLATSIANRMRGENHAFVISRFLGACKLPCVEGFNC